jgi:RND superfamily putative drug exporter
MIALWLALVVACLAGGAITGTQALTDAQSNVGQSRSAEELLDAAGLKDPAVESVLVRGPDAATVAASAHALEQRLARTPQVAAVHGPGDTPSLSARGGRAVLVQATLRGDPDDAGDHAPAVARAVRATSAAHPATTYQQAGPGSLDKAIDDVVGDDLSRAEMISLPITLLILVLAFGAVAAACVPLALGITALAAAMGALGVVSQIAPNSDSTGSLVVLIGLAVGVDYSLFYIRREREERRAGRGPHAALDAAAATVGRAIVVSGATVVVALAGLLLTGAGDFTSMALGTILVVVIAVIGSLTVLPAMLALLGDRVDRGRLPWRRRRDRRLAGGAPARPGPWARLAGVVTARPAVSLVTAVCVLGAIAVPATQMRIANPGGDDLPKGIPVLDAQRAIDNVFGSGTEDGVLVVRGERLGAHRAALHALGARATHAAGTRGRVAVQVARDERTAAVAFPMTGDDEDVQRAAVHRVRHDVLPTARRVEPGATAQLTGSAAEGIDFTDRLRERTPIVVALVLGVAFVLLLGAFGSPALAAGVIGLNLLSIAAAYGVIVGVFQYHWAEGLLGFTSTGTITSWLPLFAFVILFGLSMDYTILVLERVREARRAGRNARDAAAEGVAATGGTVTSAAIVMVAVFAVFATLRLVSMKQLGVGLASAVLLDATIVRGVALPALITLLGEKRWRVRGPRRGHHDVAWDDRARVALAPEPEHVR